MGWSREGDLSCELQAVECRSDLDQPAGFVVATLFGRRMVKYNCRLCPLDFLKQRAEVMMMHARLIEFRTFCSDVDLIDYSFGTSRLKDP